MIKGIDFQWDMKEEDFRSMMAETKTTDLFGSVRFGNYLVEFRCTGGGYDVDYHVPTTDIFLYGEMGPEQYFLSTGTPYKLLDDEFRVMKRRTMNGFKRAFEAQVKNSTLEYEHAVAHTLSWETWNPGFSKEVI